MVSEPQTIWRLRLQEISKQFPGVKALDQVDFTLAAGEVHALCGENGAGKSTLMNILSGNIQPDTGSITVNGANAIFINPQAGFAQGIAIVYQHLSLVDSMSVAENIYANQQPHNQCGVIDFKALYHAADLLLKRLHINISAKTSVAKLSPAQKQMIEIAKALSKKPQILIFDEPTASLTERETSILFDIIRELKENHVSIIYISHRMEEIFTIADRVTILKDGKKQGTFNKDELNPDQLIKLMVGREVKKVRKQSSATNEVLMQVKHLTGTRFSDINFDLHRGEILGIAGLVGAGRTEVARAIFGADNKTGQVFIHQHEVNIKHPADAIKYKIAYVPEDRKLSGLFLDMSVTDNTTCLAPGTSYRHWFFNPANAIHIAQKYVEKLRISTSGIKQRAVNLSGGNQQKVVLAKWLLTQPEILIVDEPTHGIDVGAKFEIYELLIAIANEGKGIIMISSDMPELLGLCDRIIVLRQGKISGELAAANASEEKIMALAT